ncbi:hypothetical protein ACET98_22265 [Aeromonas veronii]
MSSSDITLIIILAIIALPSIGLFVVSRKKNKITLERDEAIKEARAAKDDVAREGANKSLM